MPTSTYSMVPCPFIVDNQIDPQSPIGLWLTSIQNSMLLKAIDTSAGNYSENPPPAGSSITPGQSNQGQIITYIKISADGNVFTLNGVQGGPYMLNAQYDVIKIQSNGTVWFPIG